jgi:hypothetical protein
MLSLYKPLNKTFSKRQGKFQKIKRKALLVMVDAERMEMVIEMIGVAKRWRLKKEHQKEAILLHLTYVQRCNLEKKRKER